MTKMLSSLVLGAVCLAFLPACIESEGRSATSSVPVLNVAPQFAGDGELLLPENITGTILTVSAEDRNGDTLVYNISGGADAAVFSINSASGALSLVAPLDYELPVDSGGDNLYQVTISAFDGQGGEGIQNISVTVTDDRSEIRYFNTIFKDTTTSPDIAYGLAEGEILQLNIVTATDDTETNRPVIILASGGGFITTNRLDVETIASNFARAGYVAAIIDYRTLTDRFVDAPENAAALAVAGVKASHDMAAAIRYIRANAATYNADPNRVIAGGVSAGAIMAATLITADAGDTFTPEVSDYIAANGGVYGDVGNDLSESSVPQAAFIVSGGILNIDHIDANSLPFFAAHEELDPIVPCLTSAEGSSGTGLVISGSCDMVTAYNNLNLPAQLYLVPNDAAHVGYSGDELLELFTFSLEFFFINVVQ